MGFFGFGGGNNKAEMGGSSGEVGDRCDNDADCNGSLKCWGTTEDGVCRKM